MKTIISTIDDVDYKNSISEEFGTNENCNLIVHCYDNGDTTDSKYSMIELEFCGPDGSRFTMSPNATLEDLEDAIMKIRRQM